MKKSIKINFVKILEEYVKYYENIKDKNLKSIYKKI